MNCEHGFVVRDILGVNRFLCRECKERFRSYPRRGKQRIPSIVDKIAPEIIDNALCDEYTYAKGITQKYPLTYTFPVVDKATFSYTFVGDGDEYQ